MTQHADPVPVILDVPITFDVGERSVHSPMVHASVGGVATKLILDTGATEHVLTLELVSVAGLSPTPTEPGMDHAGESVPSWIVAGARVEVGGVRLEATSYIAIEGPAPFEAWGIGGFLSPQDLHPRASVVIDLVENRLILLDAPEPVLAAWLRDRFEALHHVELRRKPGEAVRVLAGIEPNDPVVTMLNTGTPDTEFAQRAAPGLRGIAPEDAGLGVSGAEVSGTVVRDRILRVADVRLPVPALFLRDRMPPEHPDGQIGMDLLKDTVLAVSPGTRPVHWLVP